jgi:DNA-binding NarL/FixJ family response regulator
VTSADSRRAAIRLVVADDDEAHVVAEAADRLEAVAVAVEHAPHLILLDVHMPRLDGLQAALRIREASPETTIVLHTCELSDEISAQARKLGLRVLAKSAFDDDCSAALLTL